jgi:hypothetical protein
VGDALRVHRVPVLIRRDLVCIAGAGGVIAAPGIPNPAPHAESVHASESMVCWSIEPSVED